MENLNNLSWIPNNTKSIKVKYYCISTFSGGTPSTNNSKYWDGDIPWLASGKAQNEIVDSPSEYITELGFRKSSTRLIKPNSPIMAMTGATCANVGFLTFKACANQSIFAYEINDKIADGKFVYYALIAARKAILNNQQGGAVSGINGDVCKNIIVPFKSMDEQIAISSYLDKKTEHIDGIIENEKTSLDDLKKYLYRITSETILAGLDKKHLNDCKYKWINRLPDGWSLGRIGSFCYTKGRIGWQGLTTDEYQDKGPYLITGTDFDNGLINWNTCEHITEARYEEAAPIKVKEGDLLITKDGTVGKVAIVIGLNGKASLNSGVLMIRNINNKYKTKYLYYVLKSSVFWDWFNQSQKGNSTIIHLYQEQFRKFIFPLPTIEEQEEIVNYLDQKCDIINQLINIKKEKIELLKSYKKSLIYELVIGKKEVHNA